MVKYLIIVLLITCSISYNGNDFDCFDNNNSWSTNCLKCPGCIRCNNQRNGCIECKSDYKFARKNNDDVLIACIKQNEECFKIEKENIGSTGEKQNVCYIEDFRWYFLIIFMVIIVSFISLTIRLVYYFRARKLANKIMIQSKMNPPIVNTNLNNNMNNVNTNNPNRNNFVPNPYQNQSQNQNQNYPTYQQIQQSNVSPEINRENNNHLVYQTPTPGINNVGNNIHTENNLRDEDRSGIKLQIDEGAPPNPPGE